MDIYAIRYFLLLTKFQNIKYIATMSSLTIKKIFKKNLIYNILQIKKQIKNKKVCAMVKANAYGHGLDKVVKGISPYVDYFGVANLQEALQIRKICFSIPILIVGKTTDFLQAINNDISISIFSKEEMLNLLNCVHNYALNYLPKIHIKINSGMNRFGIKNENEFLEVLKLASDNGVLVEGVFTHFSTVGVDNQVFNNQKKVFENFIKLIPNKINPIIHVGGSACIFKNQNNFDMFRVGIMLYGYGSNKISLKKVMSIETEVVDKQIVKSGEHIGYGIKYVAEKDMVVGVIPIGYADGLSRQFSNGFVKLKIIDENSKIKFRKCKIVGNICMDLTMIDLTDIKSNDKILKVIVMNNADEMAKSLNTISYEILTNFNKIREQ